MSPSDQELQDIWRAVNVSSIKATVIREIVLPLVGLGLVVLFLTLGDTRISRLGKLIIVGIVAMNLVALLFIRTREVIHLALMAKRLSESGMFTQGRVVEKLQSRESGEIITYDIMYEYLEHYRAWQEVDAAKYEQLSVGDSVPVKYLPDDPRYSRIEF